MNYQTLSTNEVEASSVTSRIMIQFKLVMAAVTASTADCVALCCFLLTQIQHSRVAHDYQGIAAIYSRLASAS